MYDHVLADELFEIIPHCGQHFNASDFPVVIEVVGAEVNVDDPYGDGDQRAYAGRVGGRDVDSIRVSPLLEIQNCALSDADLAVFGVDSFSGCLLSIPTTSSRPRIVLRCLVDLEKELQPSVSGGRRLPLSKALPCRSWTGKTLNG